MLFLTSLLSILMGIIASVISNFITSDLNTYVDEDSKNRRFTFKTIIRALQRYTMKYVFFAVLILVLGYISFNSAKSEEIKKNELTSAIKQLIDQKTNIGDRDVIPNISKKEWDQIRASVKTLSRTIPDEKKDATN